MLAVVVAKPPAVPLSARLKRAVPVSLVQFWRRAVDADYGDIPKPGRDLYIYIVIVQLLLLVWILLGFSAFAEVGQGISSGILSNRLSGYMVRRCFDILSCLARCGAAVYATMVSEHICDVVFVCSTAGVAFHTSVVCHYC